MVLYLSTCLSLSVCLSVCLSVSLSVSLPTHSNENIRAKYLNGILTGPQSYKHELPVVQVELYHQGLTTHRLTAHVSLYE